MGILMSTLYGKPRQCIKKQRHYFVDKICTVKAVILPVVTYGCESWTIKKAGHQRIDVFRLWLWRRLLRVPWTTRKWNQSILTEINPECSLEALMLKLKLQYFGHLMQTADSLETTLTLGNTEDRKRRGWQRMRWLDDIMDSTDISLGKFQQTVKDREAWRAAIPWSCKESDMTWWLNNNNGSLWPNPSHPSTPSFIIPSWSNACLWTTRQ